MKLGKGTALLKEALQRCIAPSSEGNADATSEQTVQVCAYLFTLCMPVASAGLSTFNSHRPGHESPGRQAPPVTVVVVSRSAWQIHVGTIPLLHPVQNQ